MFLPLEVAGVQAEILSLSSLLRLSYMQNLAQPWSEKFLLITAA